LTQPSTLRATEK